MKYSFVFTVFFFIFSMLLCCTLTSPLSVKTPKVRCHPDDRKALIEINAAMGLDAVEFGYYDCCRWRYSVFCDFQPPYRVIDLRFRGIPISGGHISPAIGDLPYLQSFTFHHLPNLTGTIPPSIGKLTKLTSLDISFTGVSGPIPAFLAKNKNLEYLTLSYNNFTGSIPPQLSQLKNLVVINLSRNKLTGTIPESFGLFTQPNTQIDLSHNQLSGPIPISVGNSNYTSLDLSRNNLTGDASFLFAKNKTSIGLLDLSRNNLTFDLSKVEFPESLFWLDLNHNNIFGSIPQQLTQVENMDHFNVSYNRLCGEIPQGGSLQGFDVYSYLHNRCLCGAPLPPCT